jgi:hypothetical protein
MSFDSFSLLHGELLQFVYEPHYLKKEERRKPLPSSCKLPATGNLFHEREFAKVYFGYHEGGIELLFELPHPFREEEKENFIEIFINTRVQNREKSSFGFNTKFCHHFHLTSQKLQEITKWRHLEKREPQDGSKAVISVEKLFSATRFSLFLPNEILYGYDLSLIKEIGFSYIIHHAYYGKQHFSLSSTNFSLKELFSLLATFHLRPV